MWVINFFSFTAKNTLVYGASGGSFTIGLTETMSATAAGKDEVANLNLAIKGSSIFILFFSF